MTDFEGLLRALVGGRVGFILVGGVAALNLERLIRVKRAAGRPKDLEAIAELEALLEERDKLGG